ncbi:hypothetical protein PCE1_001848 [Barthelona sp. PCE]
MNPSMNSTPKRPLSGFFQKSHTPVSEYRSPLNRAQTNRFDTEPITTKEPRDTSNIQVYLRVRPLFKAEKQPPCLRYTGDAIHMDANKQHRMQSNHSFKFSYVFDVIEQQEAVFSTTSAPLVDYFLSGYNATIFAYGATGSGKTHSLFGPNKQLNPYSDDCGIIPRCVAHIFALLDTSDEEMIQSPFVPKENNTTSYTLTMNVLEIYNERVTDLISNNDKITLHELPQGGVYPQGCTEITLVDVTQTIEVLRNCIQKRKTRRTKSNERSSRSHCIVQFRLESKRRTGDRVETSVSVLSCIDLAGSERQAKTGAIGKTLREAGRINQSLTTLSLVVKILNAKARGKMSYVPYRNSKLTFLLKNSLGNNAKTSFLSCISVDALQLHETLSTLRFSSLAQKVTCDIVRNTETIVPLDVLQEEMQRLRSEVQRLRIKNRDLQANTGGVTVEEQSTLVRLKCCTETQLDEVLSCSVCDNVFDVSSFKPQSMEAALRYGHHMEHLFSRLLNHYFNMKAKYTKSSEVLLTEKMYIRALQKDLEQLSFNHRTPSEEYSREDLEKVNAELRTQLEVMEKKLDPKNHPVVLEFLFENFELQQQVTSLREQLDAYSGKSDMQNDINSLLDQIKTLLEQKRHLEHVISSSSSQLKSGMTPTPAKTPVAWNGEENMPRIRFALDDIEYIDEEINEEINEETELLRARLMELEADNETLLKENAALREELSFNLHNTVINEIPDEMSPLHDERSVSYRTDIDSLEKSIANLSNTVSIQSEKPLKDEPMHMSDLDEDDDSLRTVVKQELYQIQNEAKGLQELMHHMNQQKDEAYSEIIKLERHLNESRMHAFKVQETMMTERNEMEKRVLLLEGELTRKDMLIKQQSRVVDRLQEQLYPNNEENDDVDVETSEVEVQTRVDTQYISTVEREVAKLLKENSEMRNQAKDKVLSSQSQKNEVLKLQKMCNQLSVEREDMDTELRVLRKKLQALDNLSAVKVENEFLERRNQMLALQGNDNVRLIEDLQQRIGYLEEKIGSNNSPVAFSGREALQLTKTLHELRRTIIKQRETVEEESRNRPSDEDFFNSMTQDIQSPQVVRSPRSYISPSLQSSARFKSLESRLSRIGSQNSK